MNNQQRKERISRGLVLKKHPTRALKCDLADWYMKQGGDENREKAAKLLEEYASGEGERKL